jgi:hypothetical protein
MRVRWGVPGFQFGDRTIVRGELLSCDGRMPYYLVTMSEDAGGRSLTSGPISSARK